MDDAEIAKLADDNAALAADISKLLNERLTALIPIAPLLSLNAGEPVEE
jgi:hypothetical protein